MFSFFRSVVKARYKLLYGTGISISMSYPIKFLPTIFIIFSPLVK